MAWTVPNSADAASGKPITTDWGTMVANDLIDLDQRAQSIGVASQAAFFDDFSCGQLDTAYWDSANGGGTSGAFYDVVNHLLELRQVTSNQGSLIAGAVGKMRLRLTNPWAINLEFRMYRTGQEISTYQAGLNDVGITTAAAAGNDTNFIGFERGSVAGTWRGRCSAGGVTTDTANFGSNAAPWTNFKISISTIGGTNLVHFYTGSPYAEVSGSPISTNITTVTLRPFAGVLNGANLSVSLFLDYFLCYPTLRPLSP